MKIDSAGYSLTSSHLSNTVDESSQSLRVWTGARRPDFETRAGATASAVSLSSAALTALAADLRAAMSALPAPQTAVTAPPAAAIDEAADAVANDPFLTLVKSMVEMLTGHSIRIFSAKDVGHRAAPPSISGPGAAAPAAAPRAAAARPAGFGIEYDSRTVHQESEQTRITAEGTVKTADGREISFKLNVSMTRSYREETSLSIRSGDAVRKDPLVLNFNGTAAQLSDLRFAFDLNSDGSTENLALLTAGSGYLAIDRNGNGRIDSGSELFGPATDSGFSELSALDSDHNGWIDENDAAFESLRIWTPDAKGDGSLETLRQRQVGAIAAGSVASPFELRGAGNSDLGAVAASGVFLAEDGTPGTVQEINLSI